MKTSMQKLYDDLEAVKVFTDTISISDVQRMIGHYKNGQEKQDIIKAHDAGIENPDSYGGGTYYKETFDTTQPTH